MLYAIRNSKRVKADKQLINTNDFICTYRFCDTKYLEFCKGNIRNPYFRHKIHSYCEELSERDADAHDAMKEFFQKFLEIEDENVEYGKIKGVRPDLLWKNKYSIEVQHSPIQPEEIERRNGINEDNKLIPVWIFHQKELIPKFKPGEFGADHDYDDYLLRLKVSEVFHQTEKCGLFYFQMDKEFGYKLFFTVMRKITKFIFNSTSIEIKNKEEFEEIINAFYLNNIESSLKIAVESEIGKNIKKSLENNLKSELTEKMLKEIKIQDEISLGTIITNNLDINDYLVYNYDYIKKKVIREVNKELDLKRKKELEKIKEKGKKMKIRKEELLKKRTKEMEYAKINKKLLDLTKFAESQFNEEADKKFCKEKIN